MSVHTYTTLHDRDAFEKALRALADTSFTLLLSSRVIQATMNGDEIRASGYFMRTRGTYEQHTSGDEIVMHYRFSRLLVIPLAGLVFMVTAVVVGDLRNVGELGTVLERILATVALTILGLVGWGMSAIHKRSFIRRIEHALKLTPKKDTSTSRETC